MQLLRKLNMLICPVKYSCLIRLACFNLFIQKIKTETTLSVAFHSLFSENHTLTGMLIHSWFYLVRSILFVLYWKIFFYSVLQHTHLAEIFQKNCSSSYHKNNSLSVLWVKNSSLFSFRREMLEGVTIQSRCIWNPVRNLVTGHLRQGEILKNNCAVNAFTRFTLILSLSLFYI